MKSFPKVLMCGLVFLTMLLPGMTLADEPPHIVPDDAPGPAPAPAASDYPFRTVYPPLASYYSWYNTLVSEFPGLVTKIDIGNTIEGRDLWVLRLTSDEDTVVAEKPAVFIEGNIHAREWSCSQAVAYFTWWVLYNYETNNTIHWLLNNRVIYVLPMANPDGYYYDGDGGTPPGDMWRKNRRNNGDGTYGVDLNRNWDCAWEQGNDVTSADDYHGTAPFSEPETQAISGFLQANDIESFQCVHSYAGTLLIPWCYTSSTCPHDSWYRDTAARMTSLTTQLGAPSPYSYGQPYETIGYSAPGGSIDWAYDAIGAQGFCFELETGGAGFYPGTANIMTINQDVDDALLYQSRVADTDIGDGTVNLFPPVPYVVYGTVNGVSGPLPDTLVTVTNTATSESISIMTDSNGYFELDFGTLPSYTISQTFNIAAHTYSGDFNIGTEWGREINLGPVSAPADLTVDWSSESVQTLYQEGFEGDGTPTFAELGWTTGGTRNDWQLNHPGGLGGDYGSPDPSAAYQGSFVIGNDLTGLGTYPGDYEASIGVNTNYIRSPAVDCSDATGTTLSFRRWLGVEQPAYDHAYIEVSTDGSTFSQVWTNAATIADAAWNLQTLDISSWADGHSTVYLRFELGATDGGWQYCGWNIDDLRVQGLVSTGSNDNNLLNWTLSPDDGAGLNTVTQYNIYRSSSPSGPWDSGTLLTSVPAGTDTYTDLGRGETDGITWWYVVRAASAWGDEDSNTDAVPEPGVPLAPYSIDLAGKPANSWVFVSFPHDVSGSITTILNDAALGDSGTTWTVAKYWDSQTPADPWKTYRLGSSVNDMPNIDNTMGVWLWLTANSGDQRLTLGQAGVYPPASVVISLEAGWNMVGYPSLTGRAESATLPAQADYVASWQAASPYISQHAKGATVMAHGNAYWVHATADCTWTVSP